ncbi:hypothetical protein ARMSODRAFT_962169 [Armillaria solidipes]|uniref:Uncharacterized protein n=1 Tax=Armillaria solidipes TaxID=1076256 RepID=A0A2H3B659_9AGAR|nr:hypothetical protein ARMSODRAFT_962169 [Armillaria solidipes]
MYNYPQVFFPPEPASVASLDTPIFVLGPLLREQHPPPSTQLPEPKDYSDAESDAPTEVATDVEEEIRIAIYGTIADSECITGEGDVLAPLSQAPKTPSDRKLSRLPSTGQREPRCKRDVKRGFPDQEPPSPSPPVGKKKKVLTKRMPMWCTSRALVPCETGLMRAPASDASDLPTSSPSGGKRGRGYEADDESEKPKKKPKAEESDNVALDAGWDTTESVQESQVLLDGSLN